MTFLHSVLFIFMLINHSYQWAGGREKKEAYSTNCETNKMCEPGKFPKSFIFGAGSSSYQVEGAWNEDGKGPSILDAFYQKRPNASVDSSTGDVACDSYHLYETDVGLVKNLGADFYRFSISWPRILPTGDPTQINQQGIDYYNKLINECLENGIQPVVTIFHWETPLQLEAIGGWTNRAMVDYYVDFSRILFQTYGDRVKLWVTLNEPQLYSVFGYGQTLKNLPVHPPGVNMPGVADYLSAHHLLLGHAKVYKMYKNEFYSKQGGKLGIAANLFAYRPATSKPEDIEAAKRNSMFEAGWILHPFLKHDYPPIMRERIDRNSKEEGRSHSRLPRFTQDEIDMMKGSLDYVGLNYYTSMLAKNAEVGPQPSYIRDTGVSSTPDPMLMRPGVSWLAHDAAGLRLALKWIKDEFENPPIFITENGCDDPNGLDDDIRINYHKEHLQELLSAMQIDGCQVFGYTVWSLMDSFEWTSGYTAKFGLYQVDFKDPKRKRTPKKSVQFFQKLHLTRKIDN